MAGKTMCTNVDTLVGYYLVRVRFSTGQKSCVSAKEKSTLCARVFERVFTVNNEQVFSQDR
jgi:hypothetical protein